jgi:hypothetical protein
MPPVALVLLSVNCSHGPIVTACVVDSYNHGLQCYEGRTEKGFFVSFSDGSDLKCTNPEGLEDFLKRCKDGTQKEVLWASPLESQDNDFCLSPQDLKRVKERCGPL